MCVCVCVCAIQRACGPPTSVVSSQVNVDASENRKKRYNRIGNALRILNDWLRGNSHLKTGQNTYNACDFNRAGLLQSTCNSGLLLVVL